MKAGYKIAIVGASGAVGGKMLEMLAETTLPISEVKLLASKRSAGQTRKFQGQELVIEELVAESFAGIDIALFSAGGSVSQVFAPEAVKRGAVVIDNTSFFRMDPQVPLVVPEVNSEVLREHQGIIANPNCSTIQMMVALEPLRKAAGLQRIIVSTYQAVSGAGAQAVAELKRESQALLDGVPVDQLNPEILPAGGDKKHYPIAFNALPQIDVFAEEDYTYEEWKMINETRKIMADDTIKVAATCVRIPVVSGHSESIYLETEQVLTPEQVKKILAQAPGVALQDDPANQIYPQALNSVDQKATFVGRIRRDLDVANGLHLWVVSDNLVKGAAWNSVQIAETLHEMDLVRVP